MTNQQHPITPPPELVQQWLGEYFGTTVTGEVSAVEQHIATQAARWGSDRELEACCQALRGRGTRMRCMEAKQTIDQLRAARRPKPPSLKEQALNAARIELLPDGKNAALIIRALEALPDD